MHTKSGSTPKGYACTEEEQGVRHSGVPCPPEENFLKPSGKSDELVSLEVLDRNDSEEGSVLTRVVQLPTTETAQLKTIIPAE